MPNEKETVGQAGAHCDGKMKKVNRGGGCSDWLLFRRNLRRIPTVQLEF